MATPATYTSRMGESPSPGRGGSRRRSRRCHPGPAGRRRSSSRRACRSGVSSDRARRRSGCSAPTRPRAGRRRRPRTAPGPRAWTGTRSTIPRPSPCVTAGSPRTAPRRCTGSRRAAPPGRLPRTACSAGRPGRARPRRAGGGRARSRGGRAARWSQKHSRRSRSTARRPMSSAGHGPRRGVCLAAMDPFQGRVAVITGGGGGIGAAMARAFAARGARIVLADVDRAAMEAVAAALGRGGTEVLAVPTDVTALESVRALADAAERRFGAVHIVCNNAGVATMGETAASTHADWQYTMNVNFWGVVHGVETFVPRLLARGAGGHVVNTASMAGLGGVGWLGGDCAPQFAGGGRSPAPHPELPPPRIGGRALCPLSVQTHNNENSIRNRPAALQNPGGAAVPQGAAMAGSVIRPEEGARRGVRGIERKDLYIFTHPEQRPILQRRAARQDRMFEPDRW